MLTDLKATAMSKKNMNWGLGSWFRRDCLGTTGIDSGSKTDRRSLEILTFVFLFIFWQMSITFSWKGNRYDE